MAYQDASLTCQSVDTGDVDTGATVPAIDAANTRFDIYNFGGGSGSTLGACINNGACPAALNVVKDLVRDQAASGNNACKIHGNGWHLPANQFRPVQTAGTDPMRSFQDTTQSTIDAMGLPRDNCHYTSYGQACTGGRIGDGNGPAATTSTNTTRRSGRPTSRPSPATRPICGKFSRTGFPTVSLPAAAATANMASRCAAPERSTRPATGAFSPSPSPAIARA